MYDTKKIAAIKNWLGAGTINIFGRPFAGKDYQGHEFSQLLDGTLIGGGEILRGSVIPERIKDYVRSGQLIPSDDYAEIVLPFLKQDKLAGRPLILSSVGRWHGEEPGVIQALKQSGHPLRAVIYLNISNNESHVRWLGRQINNDRLNRHDDTEEILKTRFQEFQDKTMPVIEYYKDLGMLIEIDGKKTRIEVTTDIINALEEMIA